MKDQVAGVRMAVIGATGFIGSHLTESLVRMGAAVLAVARSREHRANLQSVADDCCFRDSDIRDADSIRNVLSGFKPEVVFHLAADVDAEETFVHMGNSLRSNAVGTANVLEAASRTGTATFVYADSCKVYGNGPVPYRQSQPDAPICSYAIGKSAGWRLCRLAGEMTGMAVCSLRSTSAYGPRQSPNLITHVRDCVRREAPVRLLGGGQTRDLIFVDDLVQAFIAAATRPDARGRAVPVGGGREVSVAQICRLIVRLMGGGIEVIANAQPPRPTEIWRSYCDNQEAGEILGWSPSTGLEEGLSRTLRESESDKPPFAGATAGSGA
jgi:nucleoside-diphosphate-sugar epimerase